MKYLFFGKTGKYRISHGARVTLLKCWPKRKCLIEYKGEQIITMVSLLRRIHA